MERARVAVYPGSFDPITNGHVDIVDRSLRIFDRVTISISTNGDKGGSLFTTKERLEMIRDVFSGHGARIKVDSFSGLLVDYADGVGAKVIIRGLRAVSDFEYEFQMAMMNRYLEGSIETLFMVPDQAYTYLSSSLIKEIYSLGASVQGMVPELVAERLRELSKH